MAARAGMPDRCRWTRQSPLPDGRQERARAIRWAALPAAPRTAGREPGRLPGEEERRQEALSGAGQVPSKARATAGAAPGAAQGPGAAQAPGAPPVAAARREDRAASTSRRK